MLVVQWEGGGVWQLMGNAWAAAGNGDGHGHGCMGCQGSAMGLPGARMRQR